MKRLFYPPPIRLLLMVIMLLLAGNTFLRAEGSVDFRNYPGHRLFYNVEQDQQLKVYAAEGETINVASSHVAINNGTIELYNPSGTLVAIYDGSDGLTAIIFNDGEELAGPIGTSSGGYTPGIFTVPSGQGGVWSVRLKYPNPIRQAFVSELLNSSPWTRARDQPDGQFDKRVALAWDVTVTQGGAGNAGGTPVHGRLYSNEYISILDGNGRSTSPIFYLLTKAGYIYQVDFSETDPWGFPIHSNSLGITTGDIVPTYMSAPDSVGTFIRSDNTSNWSANSNYLYAPQAEDSGPIINNKVFFNQPDPNMPTSATVTDITRLNTHTTWLYNTVPTVVGSARPFTFRGILPVNGPCQGDLVAEEGEGGNFVFDSELAGQATLQLDLNNNGSFNDAVDVTLTKNVEVGSDAILWDGRDGNGVVIPANPNFTFNYNLTIRGGEVHLLLSDIENNLGGVTFTRTNGPGSPDNRFYYDHSAIGGGVSGGGTSGNPLPTSDAFTYSAEFGNEVMLDQWAFIETNNFGTGVLAINIEAECSPGDHDNDGIPDIVDIDDDNDGVPDLLEYCHPTEGFACLPNGLDPSGDEDSDGIQNFQDANDPAVNNGCADANNDGICDQIAAIYDTDGDNVPDHFDLDSDNDGITDLDEAGHGQADVDRNGIIDGAPAVFGANGLFGALETNDTPTGVANYTPFDVDGDGIPDHDDLDADNDGILDVVEAGYISLDSNQDGRIDDGNGNLPTINSDGIPTAVITANGVPYPPDWDSDGVPDWRDLDSDNDGILDVIEGGYQGNDANGDGRIDDNGNPPSVNADGLPPVMATGNPITLPPDTDNDGVRDWHDLDSDNDGINGTVENKNPDGDGDGFIGTGPITVDVNGIAIADANGPLTPFTPLVNTDGTGSADFRDLDADGDGLTDVIEGGLSDPDNDGIIGSGTPTVNVFGQATEGTTSNPPDTDNDGTPDFQQVIDNSCENPATPTISVSASSVCAGEAITFTASGVTDTDVSYVWTATSADATAQFTTTEPTLTINPTSTDNSGTYTVVATRDTCSSAVSNGVSVVVNPIPPAPVLSASATSVCEGDAVTLSVNATANPNITYRWILTNGGSSSVITTTTDPSLVLNPIAANQAGTYSVEALGGGGICPSTASNGVTIAVSPRPAAPVLSASATSICEGESLTLTATGNTDPNTSYVWTATNAGGISQFTTAEPTLTFNPVTASNDATYTVEAIGGNGACPSGPSNAVSITVLPASAAQTLSSSASSVCEGEPVTLTASGSNDPTVTYQWVLTLADGSSSVVATTSDPSLTLDPTVAAQSGTYTVEALSGGGTCPSSGPSNGVAIAITAKPAPPTVTVDMSIFCEGQRLEFTATPVAGENVLYEWTFTNTAGRTDPLVTSSQPSAVIEGLVAANTGTYQVRAIVDGNTACASDFSEGIMIDVASGGLPDVIATSSAPTENPACEGDNVSLSATDVDGATYAWTGPNGYASSEQNPTIPNATSADNGVYTVTVTVNGCAKALDPVTVQVDPKPATPTISASETMVCAGEGFTLSTDDVAGDNISYEWFLGGSSLGTTSTPELIIAAASTADAGNYTVTVNNGGCPSDPSDPIEITVTPPLEGSISMEPMGGVCEGESVSLSAPTADGATYAWTGPDGFTSTDATINLENVSAANNGDYAVTVTVNGCPTDFGPVTLEINPKPATPSISSDKSSVCPGDGVTLSTTAATGDAITYDWLLDGNLVTNTQDPELAILDFQAENAGDYTVVVKDGSCPSDPSDPVTVSLQESLEGVTASSNSPVCIGDTLRLMVTDVEGATFAWTGPNDFVSTDQNPVIPDAMESDAGDYTVVVTIDGCPANIPPATVEVTPKPDAPTVSISDGPVCEGVAGTITVSDPQDNTTYTVLAADGSSVASSDMGTIEIPTDGMAGTNDYTVIAQEAGGCPSEPSNVVSLEVTPKPDEEAMIMDPNMGDGCSGAPDMIEAVPPTQGTGTWTSSNGSVVFADPTSPTTGVTGLQDGDMVTWTLSNEACGEYSSETISISAMDAEVTANDDNFNVTQPESISGGSILGNDSPNNGTITIISGPTNGTADLSSGTLNYTPNEGFAGTDQIVYQLCSAECPDICDQATININVSGITTCIVPDVITPNSDNVNDAFEIACSDFKNVAVKIFNRWGDKVYESNNYRSDWIGTYEGEPLPPGPYYYIFEEEGMEPVTGCVSIVR